MDRVPRLYQGKPPNSSAITWRRCGSSWDCRRRNFTPELLAFGPPYRSEFNPDRHGLLWPTEEAEL